MKTFKYITNNEFVSYEMDVLKVSHLCPSAPISNKKQPALTLAQPTLSALPRSTMDYYKAPPRHLIV